MAYPNKCHITAWIPRGTIENPSPATESSPSHLYTSSPRKDLLGPNKLKLLKDATVNTPVLALPDFSRPFSIETDACDTGVGAVLVRDGHPIAYLSKALGVQNQRLSIYDKEFLAVIMAIDKYRTYLQ